jgi:AcrR family transcriptional regulator
MARSGRRPGETSTREDILAAARAAFGERGFDRTTIREVARAANVDPALVHHYFGTKADLYASAIQVPIGPGALVSALADGPREQMGERIARLFFTVWENPESREPFLAMLRGALGGNDQGTAGFREFIMHGVLGRLAPALGGNRPELRLQVAVSHLVGIAVLRYVVGVAPLDDLDAEEIIAMVAPRIQSYLD